MKALNISEGQGSLPFINTPVVCCNITKSSITNINKSGFNNLFVFQKMYDFCCSNIFLVFYPIISFIPLFVPTLFTLK